MKQDKAISLLLSISTFLFFYTQKQVTLHFPVR